MGAPVTSVVPVGRNRMLFIAFLLSGFCGLLYQIVWLRQAFARFGIITPVLSVVVAVFMLGLGLGSLAGGRWIGPVTSRFRFSPLSAYAVVEGLIGVWALLVPRLFDLGAAALLQSGHSSSIGYLWQSGVAIMVAILPGCFLMGTTFPLVAAYLETWPRQEHHSFSFLYLANVIGAMAGAALTAVIVIELLGFRSTTLLGVGFNWIVAALAVWTNRRYPPPGPVPARKDAEPLRVQAGSGAMATSPMTVLFLTGFASMGMEVAWTRAFTPIVTTTIYAFAFLLTTYLLATWVGSLLYRRHLQSKGPVPTERLLWWLGLATFLPLVFNDPRLSPSGWHIFASLFPVCAVLGYLTPKLIDEYSRGAARLVGKAYAVNIAGCILGPLFTGYLLLPLAGVRWTLLALSAPFLFLTWVLASRRALPVAGVAAVGLLGVLTAGFIRTFEDANPEGDTYQVRRDHTATVTSLGTGMNKRLLVNGIGITHLTPITKVMAHLPLVSLPHRPESGLVICFGMGTTFRSLLSWGIEATAVELVPSVRDAFGYYFDDAAGLLSDPRGRVVIDDGRRYLRRSDRQFDVITLDPPPPVEAAGSSLLYSREFYRDAKARLKPGGILQQWFPGGEDEVLAAVAAALAESFGHVRVFKSIEDWGHHFLASDTPIAVPSAEEALSRMPSAASQDLMEWFPGHHVHGILAEILKREVPLEAVLPAGKTIVLTDDRPYNEYFLIRRLTNGETRVADGR